MTLQLQTVERATSAIRSSVSLVADVYEGCVACQLSVRSDVACHAERVRLIDNSTHASGIARPTVPSTAVHPSTRSDRRISQIRSGQLFRVPIESRARCVFCLDDGAAADIHIHNNNEDCAERRRRVIAQSIRLY